MALNKDGALYPKPRRMPSRFRNALGRHRITIAGACDNCGLCLSLCPYGVYKAGARKPAVIAEHLCLGPSCSENEFYCISRCPVQAISLQLNPSFELLGDKRWTADLLASTWHMAETGEIPYQGLNYKTGDSGGGFDRIRFILPKQGDTETPDKAISTAIELNRSGDNRPAVAIPLPLYLGGMSFVLLQHWVPFAAPARGATLKSLSPMTTTLLPRSQQAYSACGKRR